MMAAMGFGQVALERREVRDEDTARMETCLDALLSDGARAFDREAWGEDALGSLDSEVRAEGAADSPKGREPDRGHVAYLGYAGLALGLHRAMRLESRFAAQHDAIAMALEARFERSRSGLVETYPGETYPVDNAAALAAIALHARATGHEPRGLARGLDALRAAIDPSTGLLAQSVSPTAATSRVFERGPARGSGTALAAYFLSYADEPTSAALYRALRTSLFRTVVGFGAVLEQADGSSRGDVDSGPVVLGFGVSATGFALGASRAHGDRDAFRALYATAHLFGAPYDAGPFGLSAAPPARTSGTRTYATGGPLGDAILFAMITARPAARRPS
jgi:hypothetical protein